MKGIGEMPVSFGETALTLHRNGWRPIPLDAGTKVPAEMGWNRFNREPWNDRELELALMRHQQSACGLAVSDNLFVVDNDILDKSANADVTAAAIDTFGDTPLVRVGYAPKSVRIYRSDGTTHSRKEHPIEMFSGTGQVALFGEHAKAGRPYLWTWKTPLDLATDSDEIPTVTAAQVDVFLHACGAAIRALRKAAPRGRRGGIGLDPMRALQRYLGGGMPFHEAARLVLRGAEAGGRHAAALAVVSQAYNAGYSHEQIDEMIRRSAPGLHEYVSEDAYLPRLLNDYNPERFTNLIEVNR